MGKSKMWTVFSLIGWAIACLAVLVMAPHGARAEDGTSPTLTVVYSDLGEIGDITIPAVVVPVPKPFRPAVVAGSVVPAADRVVVSFVRMPGDAAPPDAVAAVVVGPDEVIDDPAAVLAQGVSVRFDEAGRADVVIPVVPEEFERPGRRVVYVGVRFDAVKD